MSHTSPMRWLSATVLACALGAPLTAMEPDASWRALTARLAHLVEVCGAAGPLAIQDADGATRVKATVDEFLSALTVGSADAAALRPLADYEANLEWYLGQIAEAEAGLLKAADDEGRHATGRAAAARFTQMGDWKLHLSDGHALAWRMVNGVAAKPVPWTPFPRVFGLGDPPPTASGEEAGPALDDEAFAATVMGCAPAHRDLAQHAITLHRGGSTPAQVTATLVDEQRQLAEAQALGERDRAALEQRWLSAPMGSFASDAAAAGMMSFEDPIAFRRAQAVFKRASTAWIAGIVAAMPATEPPPATAEDQAQIVEGIFTYGATACSPAHGILAKRMIEHSYQDCPGAKELNAQLVLYEQLMAAAIKADTTQRALASALLPQLKAQRHTFQAAMVEGAMSAWKDLAGWQKADASFQILFTAWLAKRPATSE